MIDNKRIVRSLIIVSCLLLILVTRLLFFNLFEAEDLRKTSTITDEWSEKHFLDRGTIYDRDGDVLARSISKDNKLYREYPGGRAFGGVVGYCYEDGTIGKTFLEKAYDYELLAKTNSGVFQAYSEGQDLKLTIDKEFQNFVLNKMKNKNGAVVALDPRTGEVLAMVSLPDFDPADEAELKKMTANDPASSFLLMNATRHLAFPASTFKIITAAAAYENGLQDVIYDDDGGFTKDGVTIKNYDKEVFGKIGMQKAFEKSCNSYFSNIAYTLGEEKMRDICERFGFGQEIKLDGLVVEKGTIDAALGDGKIAYSAKTDCAYLGIGQTVVKTTPLHMAMVCSTIANDGVMMQPYVVQDGRTCQENEKNGGKYVISPSCAREIKKLMEGVASRGTGRGAQAYLSTPIAGKTGTAEMDGKKNDSWFVGYAPANNPQIAIAVYFKEDGMTGGTTAASVAGEIMAEYLKNYNN